MWLAGVAAGMPSQGLAAMVEPMGVDSASSVVLGMGVVAAEAVAISGCAVSVVVTSTCRSVIFIVISCFVPQEAEFLTGVAVRETCEP
jgi:hypothetical protein